MLSTSDRRVVLDILGGGGASHICDIHEIEL